MPPRAHERPPGGGRLAGPLRLSIRSRPDESCPVQLLMVRLVTSQCEDPATLGSLLVKVTSQETLVVALTRKVALLVRSVVSAAEVAFVSVFWYSCPLTAEPDVTPQLSPV